MINPPDLTKNDNREVMRILPQPIAGWLFDVGFRVAGEFFSNCKKATPSATFDEGLTWIAAARKDAHAQATCLLWQVVEKPDDDFEWIEWAAKRLATEGFETFLKEQRP